jgi:hypothetical protein
MRPPRTLGPTELSRVDLILIWSAVVVLVAVIGVVLGALIST